MTEIVENCEESDAVLTPRFRKINMNVLWRYLECQLKKVIT